ncbi:CHAT domain-containing protein [Mycena vulgaris]|nr:CHAT domain-containing protein [Mycena vulgaris]
MEDLNQTVSVYEDAVRDDPPAAERAFYLSDLGIALHHRFERQGDLADLTRSLSMRKASVALTPDGDPDKPLRLNYLGNSLFARFQRLGDLGDLHKSVESGEKAVALARDGPPDLKAICLNSLAASVMLRFERLDEIEDMHKALTMQEDSVSLTPDDDLNKFAMLNNLGHFRFIRFQQLGDTKDLDRALKTQEDAVSKTPDWDPRKPSWLSNLSLSLRTRFKQLDDPKDLDRSILIQEKAVAMTPDGHHHKPTMLNNIGACLDIRFQQLGSLDDLDKSVSVREHAVSLSPDDEPTKPSMLNDLGSSLLTRFERLSKIDDIDKAISLQEQALSLNPGDHKDRLLVLTSLGNSLQTRFEVCGDLKDLEKTLLMKQQAVNLIPDGHREKPFMLSNLGNALHSRFKRHGQLEDLNKSVLITEEAAALISDSNPAKASMFDNIGCFLLTRFERLGDSGDLNKALVVLEKAVSLALNTNPNKASMLNNLGNSFHTRFQRLGDFEDLEKAFRMYSDAVSRTPDGHRDKPMWLSSLGYCLFTRFQHTSSLNALNQAVSTQELVLTLTLTEDENPQKPLWFNNLGNSLMTRFDRLGDRQDIDRAVLMHKNAASLTPDAHPDKPVWLHSLGNSLLTRFKKFGDPNDLQQMFEQYTSAARSTSGRAPIRFQAASMWAHYAGIHKNPSVLDAYQVALDLLPDLAWLALSISDRYHHITRASAVVRNAAGAAIASGQPEKAVEWLEQGRSIIWGEFLNLRTPVDDLKLKYPTLAEELIRLSAQLEGAGTRGNDPVLNDSKTRQSLESVAQQAHENANKRAELLRKIRKLKGFERFLLPKTISELASAAQAGPVVLINLSGTRCDALILLPATGGVKHVPLVEFTNEHAEDLAKSLGKLMHYAGRTDRLLVEREGDSVVPEDHFAHILSELWVRVVKLVLDALAIKTPTRDNLQRVWWCVTGPLTFLPIHAAGLYGGDDAFGSKLSDFVISSYTPSLTALIECFRSPTGTPMVSQLLAVAQLAAFGQAYLPGTREEIDHIQHHASGGLPVLRLEEDTATVDGVKAGMLNSNWVHFACHGVQVISDPTQSALLLAGKERLSLSSIIKLSLPHANFAFLSACQTATGDKKLQEESVHLAAGMLLAGYRGVIATMWTIMDNDAPQVAGDVYEHLFKTSPPDPTRAAEALHLAVRKLREQSGGKKSFFHWVPFIHVGV